MNVNGINLALIDEGPRDGTPVVLLHGFPDRGSMWHHQIAALSQAGYRVLAPDQRGFGDSDAPEGVEHYDNMLAMADTIAVLDELGITKAHVVGHDWGASVAWRMALFAPERLLSLTVVSVGHPLAFMSAGLEQKQKSWYMLAFQHAGPAEEMVQHDNFAFLQYFGTGGEEKQWQADLSRPGRLTAALNWYRANVPPQLLLSTARLELPPVMVKTMGVWSDGDDALSEAQMKNSANYVPDFRFERIDGISHWIPTAAPDKLNALLLDFLASS
jgi:pimeloyl-ACP methyl ester carboxylesterase